MRHFVTDTNIFVEGDRAYSRWNGLIALTYTNGKKSISINKKNKKNKK